MPEKTEELYRVLLDRDYPKELCAEIAYKCRVRDWHYCQSLP